MILKQTVLLTSDKSGLNLIKTFHLYGGFMRRWSKIGFFVKGSAKIAINKKYKNMNIKRKIKKIRKGQIARVIITRQNYRMFRFDSSCLYTYDNSCITFKKQKILRSKYIFGPIFRNFRRCKYKNLFKITV